MKFATLALFAGAASAAETDFPSFDALHAHCQVDLTVPEDCSTFEPKLWAEFKAGYKDPSGCSYTSKESGNDYNWLTRLTLNKKYTDDVVFHVDAAENGGCTVHMKSRSQTMSYYDYDVNYCNCVNPLRSLGVDVTKGKVSNCKFHPEASDLQKTCDRY